jgi:hypothetical protein
LGAFTGQSDRSFLLHNSALSHRGWMSSRVTACKYAAPIIWAEYRITDDRIQPSCQTSADPSPVASKGGTRARGGPARPCMAGVRSGCVSVIGRRGDSRSGLGLSGWPNQRRHCASRPRTGRPRLPTTTLSADGNEQTSSELGGAGFCACQRVPCPRAWRPEASRSFP